MNQKPMTFNEAVRDHFVSCRDDSVLERVVQAVMFWPMFPMTYAKRRHMALQLAALCAYPPLFALNIPIMFGVMVPCLIAVVVREMWSEMK